ncbi:MAG: hypothetical protein ACI9P7_000032 [Candidatus Azotimanducaceae bacterium]|jgi:hypothetical protein
MTPAAIYRLSLLTGIVLTGNLIVAAEACANELETTVTVTLDYDDNIFRDGENEIGDLKRTPSVDIDYKYRFTDVSAVLGYSVRRVDYRNDSFPDRTDFIGAGNVNWSIVDNRLSWSFDHSRNRLSIDNQDPLTPENEDDRTVMRTGPSVKLISGARTNLSLNASYVESISDQSQDTEMTKVGLDFSQRITDTFSLGLFVQTSEIKPEVEIQGYDNERVGFRLLRSSENLNLELEYGTNEVARQTGDENSSPYYSAKLSWMSTNSEFTFRANRELTDSNLGLSLNQNVGDGLNNGDGNLGNQDVIDRFHHELSYSIKFQRVRVSLGFTFDEQDFQILTQDETSKISSFSLGYDLSQRINLTYDFTQEKNEFSVGLDLKDELIGRDHSLTVRYRINDALSLQMVFREESRKHEKLPLRDYDASGALMTISYRF